MTDTPDNPTPDPTPDTPLREIKDWLFERIYDGVECPCCERLTKVYKRTLTSNIASVLIRMYRQHGQDWAYLPDLRSRGQDEAIAKHWGLIEPRQGLRPDGSNRQGWWRLTDAGVDFVLNRSTVPKGMFIYAARRVQVDNSTQISIVDALGRDFNYDDLMRGEL